MASACAIRPGDSLLFDGSTLAGWNQRGEGKWVIEEGYITAVKASGNTMLVTNESYDNYILSLAFWVDSEANSGVFIRCSKGKEISPFNCYEVNIWDDHPKQEFRTGAIVTHVSPPLAKVDSVGKWNTLEIKAVGQSISVNVNGTITSLLDDDTHQSGEIALQRFNEGVVRFKNIQLKKVYQ